MSSQRGRAAKIVEFRPRNVEPQPARVHWTLELGFLLLLLVCATLLRLDFMRAGGFVIDGDEAIVGLMANHILEGRGVPVFYYGQHYMGSLEPLCAAAMFYLFGSSPVVLQLTPLLFSLVLVVVMYALGKEVGGVVVGRVAALLCALPPVALVVWSYKARGGFIELLVIGALSLLCFLRWLKQNPKDLRYSTLTAALLGLGWWVNNQILYFLIPIGVFGALHAVDAMRSKRLSFVHAVLLSGATGLAFFMGSSPYWIYNVQNGFPSLGMFGFAPLNKVGEYVVGLWTTALPILLGAKRFWEGTGDLSPFTFLVYGVYGVAFGSVLLGRRRQLRGLARGHIERDSQVEIFFLLMVIACAVFCSSTFGWLSQAPRYLLPLYIPIFIVCGVWIQGLIRRSRLLGCAALSVLISLNLFSSYFGGRAIPGEPVVFKGDRVSREHTDLIRELDELGITKVRTNYWIGYRIAFETDERVTFLVLQEPRQVRISEYDVLPNGMSEDLVPLLLVPSERGLFVGALDLLGYTYRERGVGGYVLLYGIQRPPMNLTEIGREVFASSDATGSAPSSAAFDGSLETRWATGAPQSVGQVFELSFKEPTKIAAIRLQLGLWSQDYARGLRIIGRDVGGNRVVLLSDSDYPKLAAFFRGRDLEVWFPSRILTKIVLEQVGSHGILDWSIAELTLYTGSVDLSVQNGEMR